MARHLPHGPDALVPQKAGAVTHNRDHGGAVWITAIHADLNRTLITYGRG